MAIDSNLIFDFGFNRIGVKDVKKGEQKKSETKKKLSPNEFEELVDDQVNGGYFPEDWLKQRATMMDYVVQGMHSINPIKAKSFGHQIGQLISEIKRYQLDRPKFELNMIVLDTLALITIGASDWSYNHALIELAKARTSVEKINALDKINGMVKESEYIWRGHPLHNTNLARIRYFQAAWPAVIKYLDSTGIPINDLRARAIEVMYNWRSSDF